MEPPALVAKIDGGEFHLKPYFCKKQQSQKSSQCAVSLNHHMHFWIQVSVIFFHAFRFRAVYHLLRRPICHFAWSSVASIQATRPTHCRIIFFTSCMTLVVPVFCIWPHSLFCHETKHLTCNAPWQYTCIIYVAIQVYKAQIVLQNVLQFSNGHPWHLVYVNLAYVILMFKKISLVSPIF